MEYTENLGLRKPEDTDFASNEDQNYNMDLIDETFGEVFDRLGDMADMLDTINGEVI